MFITIINVSTIPIHSSGLSAYQDFPLPNGRGSENQSSENRGSVQQFITEPRQKGRGWLRSALMHPV